LGRGSTMLTILAEFEPKERRWRHLKHQIWQPAKRWASYLPPLDPVCSYPSLQLLEPVTFLQVSKLLSSIPPKSCCLDYIPTAIIKQCSSVFSELNAYLANLSFSQGTCLCYSASKKSQVLIQLCL